ncbi:hypothetical protein Tco_1226910 [Tanacetum coccineum]
MNDAKEMWKCHQDPDLIGIHKGYENFKFFSVSLENHEAGGTTKCNQKFLRSLPFCMLQVSLNYENKPDQVDEYDLEEMDLKGSDNVLHEIKKYYNKLVESYSLMQKNLLVLIKPKWNATTATKHGILQESVEQRKITGGGMDEILEIKIVDKLKERESLDACSGSDTAEIDDSQYTYGPEKTQPSESESQTTELDTCNSNISTEPSELVSEPVVNESNIEVQPKVWSDAPIIEEYESDSDDEYVSVQTKGLDTPSFANKQVKTPRENVKNQSTHSQKPKVNNKELGHGFTKRACFVCGSLDILIRDCDYHVKLAKQVELNKQNMSKGNGTGERKPTWNNVQRDNPHRTLKNKGIIDSGCSRHMTGNKAYLADFQDFNGGHCCLCDIQSPGKGPTWLFDLDYLTDSMNYHSVRSENQANLHAGQQESNQNTGTKDKIDAGDSEKEDESAQDCFELPIWHSYSSTNPFASKSDKKIGLTKRGKQFF